jgi:hypothetical protein
MVQIDEEASRGGGSGIILISDICMLYTVQDGEGSRVSSDLVGEEDYMPSDQTAIPVILTLGSIRRVHNFLYFNVFPSK